MQATSLDKVQEKFCDVYCTGSEASLFDSGNNGIGFHNCDHTEDAGVRCEP